MHLVTQVACDIVIDIGTAIKVKAPAAYPRRILGAQALGWHLAC